MTDYALGDTCYFTFTTRSFTTGAPTQLAGSPAVAAYEDASTTQITAGITLGVDHDSVTGLNLVTVVATSGNGYSTGKDYNLVLTAGTVGGVSVVGETIGRFTTGRSAAAQDLANATDGLSALKAILDTSGVVLTSAAAAQLVDDVWDELVTPGTHNIGASAARYLREGSEGIGVTGTAQAGGATSITLASGAVTATNIFNGEQISIIEGTGAGQARLITTSTITTDVCEVHAAWTTNPDSSSVYSIRGADANIAAIRGTVAATCTSIDFDDVASIKAKTDSLTFTVAGQVDANVQYINDVQLAGDGSGTPMDAA